MDELALLDHFKAQLELIRLYPLREHPTTASMTLTDTLTLMFPNDSQAHYDIDNLIKNHMPMVKKKWAHHGLKSWSVTKFTPNPEGIPPVYAFSTTLEWDKHDSIGDALLDRKEVNDIMSDLAKFSDKEPTIIVGEQIGKDPGDE